MRWMSPMVLMVVFAAAIWGGGAGAGRGPAARQPHGLPAEAAGQAVAPQPQATRVPERDTVRFETVDVFVDAGSTGLAAWQIEVTPRARDGAKVTLVGIEGGDHAAFAKPAYYDPAALAPAGGGRVILAAYSTGKDVPTGRTRVARLHVMVEGGVGGAEFNVNLKVAADSEGRAIDGASAAAAEAKDTSTGGDR